MDTQSLTQKIYSELRQQIIERTIPPGTRITESSLSGKWRVSRTPIREVLRHLEAEGLITFCPYKGFTVNTITTKDVEDLYTIKICLEGLAGRLASSRISNDSKKIKVLDKVYTEMKEYSRRGDVEGYVKKNGEFHAMVWQGCENRWLIKMLENLDSQINRFIVKALHIPGRIERSVGEHKDILEMLKKGNGKDVETCIGVHFQNALKDLKRELV